MWKRNLLFLALIGGGALALGANLVPPRETRPSTHYDADAYLDEDFRAAVARVDASFREGWAEQKMRPAEPAADLTIARRLSLGLMGTVPSLEEIRQFETLPETERLAWWIDHILADQRSGYYLAERLARACVGTEDGPFIFYRRRRLVNWIGEQVMKNRPYDELVRELITSTGLWTDRPATNFITVTSRPDSENQPDPIRLAGRVTRAFLGLRLDCAECHNHPYAPWKQTDFQSLAAFFGQTRLGFTGIHDGEGEYEFTDKRTNEKKAVAPRVPFAEQLLPEEGTRRERLAAWVTDARNPYFAREAVNRVWALMLGMPLVDPIDNLEVDMAIPPALGILAEDFAEHGFDIRRLVRIIACTQVFRMESALERDVTEDDEKAWAVFPLTRLRPEQVIGGALQSSSVSTIDSSSHILIRTFRLLNQGDFVKRYGDMGDDEFSGRGGTIPQRLLMMNGKLITDHIKDSPFNASTRIAWMAPDDPRAIETAYLAVLTRRPTTEETRHFEETLGDRAVKRTQRFEDLYWALINSTEFSWNH